MTVAVVALVAVAEGEEQENSLSNSTDLYAFWASLVHSLWADGRDLLDIADLLLSWTPYSPR